MRSIRITIVALVAGFFATQSGFANELTKLRPNDFENSQKFGHSVAIHDGKLLVGDSGTRVKFRVGAVYVFDMTTGQQIHKLVSPVDHDDIEFGCAVATNGKRAVVGAHMADGARGAAYVFDVVSGKAIGKLVAPDRKSEIHFGCSIAVHGDKVVIGAYNGPDSEGDDTGCAYLYDINTGKFLGKFSDASAKGDPKFGGSVAIYEDRVLIGARWNETLGYSVGVAYVFDATNGKQLFRLAPEDPYTRGTFGNAVALNGSTAAVASIRDKSGSGAVYLFDLATGKQKAKLREPDKRNNDHFGCSIALRGERLLIGDKNSNVNGPSSGIAYLFDTRTSKRLAKFAAIDGAFADCMGQAVALDDKTICIGSPGDDDGDKPSGSVFYEKLP